MNQPSIDKFLPQMKDDGIILVNSSIVKDVPRKEMCIRDRYYPAYYFSDYSAGRADYDA